MIATSIASFSRPANTTQYTAGDLVANDTDAGGVAPLIFTTSGIGRGRGIIRRAKLFKSDPSVTAALFNLHLFMVPPAFSNGDNGAFAVDTVRNFLGSIAFDLSSGAIVGTVGATKSAAPSPEINFDLTKISSSERRIYGYLATGTGGTYTPAENEVFEVTLDIAASD